MGLRLDEDECRTLIASRSSDAFYRWKPLKSGDQRLYVEATANALGTGQTSVLLGGTRSGKSDVGAYINRRDQINLAPIARMRAAAGEPTTMWIVTPKFEHGGEIVWKEKLQRMIPARDIEPDGISWVDKRRGWPQMIRLRSGLEIIFKSAEQGRDAMQGKGVFAVWQDEQIPDDVAEEISFRCIDHGAPIRITLTPVDPDPVMQQRSENPPDGWTFHSIDMEDNRVSRGGYLPDLLVDRRLAELLERNPDLYETRKRGAWSALAGQIFKGFQRSSHVIDADKMRAIVMSDPGRFHFGLGVDFGITNPMACVWGARDRDTGTWYIFDEYHQAHRPIQHLIGDITNRARLWGYPRWLGAYCDPADQSQEQGTDYRVSGRKALRESGLPVVMARKAWWESIDLISDLLARQVMVHGDGKIEYGPPRLFISSACTNLIRQMMGYRYDDRTVADRDPREARAHKADDHAVDGLRYLVLTLERNCGTDDGSDGYGVGPRDQLAGMEGMIGAQ